MSRDRVVCKENTFVKAWIVKRIMRCETKIQRQNEECMSKTIETRVLREPESLTCNFCLNLSSMIFIAFQYIYC